MNSIETALGRWKGSLGDVNVHTDPISLSKVQSTTFATEQKILAILRPNSVSEVQSCVAIANQFKMPIYPTSTGKNWGYGSRVPVVTNCVLLDLSRMNQIAEYNETLGYVRIEPGVTQQMLFEYVAKHSNGKLWVDMTASTPNSSVIANVIERGHGLTPYCDHVSKCCGFEVVLGTGEILKTGFGSFPGSTLAALDQWGLGPNLEGLFSQSNFGIVTGLTVWLMPAPEYVSIGFFGLPDANSFRNVIDQLQPLRMNGTLKSGPQFMNVYFAISRMRQYPWDQMHGKTPLLKKQALEMAEGLGISEWNGCIPLFGARAEVMNTKQQLESALGPTVSKLKFYDHESLEQLIGNSSDPRGQDLKKIFDNMCGKPGGAGLNRAYWRMKKPAPPMDQMDLDSDGCGLYAVPVTSPFSGAAIEQLTHTAEKVVTQFGFEPNLSIWGNRERTLQVQIFIPFDKTIVAECIQADLCQKEVLLQLGRLGFYPHRLNISAMSAMEGMDMVTRSLLHKLKYVFDPNNIIAPGRYS